MAYDLAFLQSEIPTFRAAGHQFLDGAYTVAQFKGISGGMGCYAQKDRTRFMLRLRTPSGIASLEHLRLILGYAQAQKLSTVHLTTRQAVQLHDLELDPLCDIMEDALVHGLFTRGGGGNYPRNVALSPLAGVERGEAFDVTPYALELDDYFLRHAPGYKLPRKYKAAFSGTPADTGCATINDIGFMAVIEQGQPKFRVWLAGGMGGSPAAGIPYPHAVDPCESLRFAEAMLRLFTAEGDYENRARARARFIPRRLGTEAFLQLFEQYLAEVRAENVALSPAPALPAETHWDDPLPAHPLRIAQKQPGLYAVLLHPLCGQLPTAVLAELVELLEKIPAAQARLSMDEELFVRNLTAEQAETLLCWAERTPSFQTSPILRSISCVGTPSCQTGILQSQALCRAIGDAAAGHDAARKLLPAAQISGCPNCCARHCAAPLGFAGRKKKVGEEMVDAFEMFVGGHVGLPVATLGRSVGIVEQSRIPGLLLELAELLEREHLSFDQLVSAHPGKLDACMQAYL